ncbi:MAG: F0F1 ATP synthase subunit A [Eubacteriales bacterium]|nr:F0F1 ATP synthase subunit A [Eubacteriales bacterium]
MINVSELGARFIFGIKIGGLTIRISESTCWSVIICAILSVLFIWLGSGLEKVPKGKQVIAEFIVSKVYDFTETNLGKKNIYYAPYLGTLFIFIFTASSFGIFGFRPVTADLNVTAALAVITFLLIQIDSVRRNGLKGRLRDFVSPYPFMLPIKIIENITLPVTLALRLFGNIFGGMIVIDLWMHLMEFLSYKIVPVPFLRAVLVLPLNGFFDLFEPAIQTYIFTILTAVNLRNALAPVPKKIKKARKHRDRGMINPDEGANAGEGMVKQPFAEQTA